MSEFNLNPTPESVPTPESGPMSATILRAATELMAATDFDDIIFRSCSVLSNSVEVVGHFTKYEPITMPSMHQDFVQIPKFAKSLDRTFGEKATTSGGRLLPSCQPGAGIYTSPLTVNVVKDINILEDESSDIFTKLNMPNLYDSTRYKWNVATYFTSGYARFSVRIWSRETSDNYAVEIMRERGDRILVTRLFEYLSSVITGKVSIEDLVFSPEMFDWGPKKLSDEILATVPMPSEEAIKSGVDSMISMVATPYDDVCVNGCASVAKLCNANPITNNRLAKSQELIKGLIHAVFGPYSLDTRTLAAMALSVLTLSENFVLEAVSKENFSQLETMVDKDILALHLSVESYEVKPHEVHCFSYYIAQMLTNIRERITL